MENTIYLTVKQLEDEFEKWLDWVNQTQGRIMIQDNDTLEVRAVLVSAQEAQDLGIELE